MEKLPDKDSNMYDLEKLKTRFNFMPRDPKDNIVSVKLKFIELDVGLGRRISYTDYGKRSDIYNLIDDALNKKNISLDNVTVTKVRIQIQFKKIEGERRARTVTFEIGTPDRCNLKDSSTHQIAQKYVERWGLISDETFEIEENETETNNGHTSV